MLSIPTPASLESLPRGAINPNVKKTEKATGKVRHIRRVKDSRPKEGNSRETYSKLDGSGEEKKKR